MLAHIVSLMKNIVIVGSHGKTTTTSLITSIFQETKLDPTIINGGVINSINASEKSVVIYLLVSGDPSSFGCKFLEMPF